MGSQASIPQKELQQLMIDTKCTFALPPYPH